MNTFTSKYAVKKFPNNKVLQKVESETIKDKSLLIGKCQKTNYFFLDYTKFKPDKSSN